MARRRVVVTGVGLVSNLGEGAGPHLEALETGGTGTVDAESFAPFAVFPTPDLDHTTQIERRGDLRQMGPWQRLGVHAAGLALDSAGLRGDAARKDAMELLVSAGGGERDETVDFSIASGMLGSAEPDAYLNARLVEDLRPTLFLAQLSNLLAGNIAIVHGVAGGARTFMGEEQAGVDALRVAVDRVAAGQCGAIMVGGAYSAPRRDMLLLLALGGGLHEGGFVPVFDPRRRGMIMGSVGAFLVLEPAEAADARGARVLAEITGVASGWATRRAGGVRASLDGLLEGLGARGDGALALSAATGLAPWTAEERAALEAASGTPARAAGDLFGHGLEAAFPAAVALAALATGAGPAPEALVTGASQWRGEGAARLIAPGRA